MKKYVFMLFSIILIAAFNTRTAEALTLSEVDGTWSNTVGGTNVNYPANVPVDYGNGSEDQVRWGDNAGFGQSGLGFTGAAPPPSSFEIGDSFEMGQLRHFNTPIYLIFKSCSLDYATHH